MLSFKISKLGLRNFRCFGSLDIADFKQIVVLAGKNGSGKTSILEALSLFSPGKGLRNAQTAQLRSHDKPFPWKVTIAITTNPAEILWLATHLVEDKTRKVLINDKPVRQIELNKLLKIIWVTPLMDRLWVEGPEGRRRFLDRLAMGFFPDHPLLINKYTKALRERNLLLRERNVDNSWFNAIESQMAALGSQITKNRLETLIHLNHFQSLNSPLFPAAILGLSQTEPKNHEFDMSDKDALQARWSTNRSRDLIVGKTLEGPHRADLKVNHAITGRAAQSCSTGEQKLILLSIVIGNARALAKTFGTPPIVLFDEVVAHLDPKHRSVLITEITNLNSQVFMTGTEANLFPGLGSEAQFLNTSDFETN